MGTRGKKDRIGWYIASILVMKTSTYFVKKFNRREFYDCEVVCLNKLSGIPGVPQIFGLDEACLAVMASSIGKRITTYRKSPSEFAGIFGSIHSKGILYRDIRPSNVMVIDSGGRISPLIIDFGCADDLDSFLKPYAGKIHYAAAEVCVGTNLERFNRIGAQSAYDLESLVLVMWELRCEEALRVIEIEHRQYMGKSSDGGGKKLSLMKDWHFFLNMHEFAITKCLPIPQLGSCCSDNVVNDADILS